MLSLSYSSIPGGFFLTKKYAQKSIFGRGSVPDPTGGAYNACTGPPTQSLRGHPSPYPPLCLWCLNLSANEIVVIGPCENGFTGPALALNGPEFFWFLANKAETVKSLGSTKNTKFFVSECVSENETVIHRFVGQFFPHLSGLPRKVRHRDAGKLLLDPRPVVVQPEHVCRQRPLGLVRINFLLGL